MENQENGDLQDSQNESIVDPQASTESKSQEQLSCWLYVSRTCTFEQQQQSSDATRNYRNDALPRANLEEAIRAVEPAGPWNVSETHCGVIAGFARETDADKLLQRTDLARIFEGPVQVARFCDRDSRYRQAVLLRDVPWAIPLQDLHSALARQGIATGSIERLRHYVRVEVLESGQYEQLLRQGLDFFGAARFCAIPERWWRNGNGAPGAALQTLSPLVCSSGVNQIVDVVPNQPQQQHPQQQQPQQPAQQPQPQQQQPAQQQQQQQQQIATDDVLQCYRCQGFWHVAANCRHLPRCVRCGEPHSVEFCARPRNNPVCCHCAGPHHAGYRQCPVRLQLLNATPVSLTLSANRLSSGTPSTGLYPYGKSGSANNNGSGNNATAATTNNNNSAPAPNAATTQSQN